MLTDSARPPLLLSHRRLRSARTIHKIQYLEDEVCETLDLRYELWQPSVDSSSAFKNHPNRARPCVGTRGSPHALRHGDVT